MKSLTQHPDKKQVPARDAKNAHPLAACYSCMVFVQCNDTRVLSFTHHVFSSAVSVNM